MTDTTRYWRHGAVCLRPLIAPEIATAIAHQVSLQVAQSGNRCLAPPSLGNKPCFEIYGYQWPMLLTFMWGLTPRIEAIVGRPLLPTYSYFRTYQQGDVCRVHADRAACQHSVSLTLDYADGLPWALSVADTPTAPADRVTRAGAIDFAGQGHVEFAMSPGDAVLYRGVEYRHARLQPNPNRWSAHLFMHWVERDGEFAAEAFDRHSVHGVTDFRFPAVPA